MFSWAQQWAQSHTIGRVLGFAQVIKVDNRSKQPSSCAPCSSHARKQIAVQWEAGYVSPDGNVRCESCVARLVTAGANLIAFSRDEPTLGNSRHRVEVNLN